MGALLDIDDVAGTSELAAKELSDMRAEIAALKAEVARQHEEIMHLRMYAPGQREEHKPRPAPVIGPVNWRFWGLEEAEKDFDSFGKPVPNESEL